MKKEVLAYYDLGLAYGLNYPRINKIFMEHRKKHSGLKGAELVSELEAQKEKPLSNELIDLECTALISLKEEKQKIFQQDYNFSSYLTQVETYRYYRSENKSVLDSYDKAQEAGEKYIQWWQQDNKRWNKIFATMIVAVCCINMANIYMEFSKDNSPSPEARCIKRAVLPNSVKKNMKEMRQR